MPLPRHREGGLRGGGLPGRWDRAGELPIVRWFRVGGANSLKPWARLPDGRVGACCVLAARLPARGSAVDDLIQEFLVESNENLDRYDSELVKLESEPNSQALLSSIFRSIHSIKGACGFLGFQKLEKLAHAGENLLSKLRDGQIQLTPEIGSALLETGDGIRKMLASIGASGTDGDEEFLDVIARLKGLQEGGAAPTPAGETPAAHAEPVAEQMRATGEVAPGAKAEIKAEIKAETKAEIKAEIPEPAVTEPRQEEPRITPAPGANATPRKKKHLPQAGRLGGTLVERAHIKPEDLARALEAQEKGDARPIGEILISLGVVSAQEVAATLRLLEEARSKSLAQDSTIRVNVNLLDRLMNLVGELVLARNQLLQFAGQQEETALAGSLQRLNLVTTELREGVMKTRMQPISRLFDKVPRVVRDVSVACGKQVRVETEGKETELDRTLLEAMNDPLTHLVRNAIDHGVESPEKRAAAGKSAEGLLRLRALHEGGRSRSRSPTMAQALMRSGSARRRWSVEWCRRKWRRGWGRKRR